MFCGYVPVMPLSDPGLAVLSGLEVDSNKQQLRGRGKIYNKYIEFGVYISWAVQSMTV